jgi:lipoprotein-releasing system permease protein
VQRALPPGAAPEVLTWEQQNAVFLGAVDLERAMMTLVLFVVMLIAAFLIYATLNMMVAQKVKDIGILTALGGAPAAVGAIFTRCGFVIGVLGGLLGLGAGILSTIWLDAFDKWMLHTFGFELFPSEMFDLPQIPYQLESGWIALVALAALALSLLVAWRPARRAARMHPVEALSYE